MSRMQKDLLKNHYNLLIDVLNQIEEVFINLKK